MKWLVCTNMPPEPHAGSKTMPWSGSMTLTIICTSEGGVKNSPLSCAPCIGELHQEVFVDAAEHVAAGGAEQLAVENAEQVFQHLVLKLS